MYIYYYTDELGIVVEKVNNDTGIIYTGNTVYFNRKSFRKNEISISRISDYLDIKWASRPEVTMISEGDE